MNNIYALVIGRFQPLCNHHVSMLQEIVTQYHPQKLFLGVGVATKMDERNFLNYDQIKKMLIPVLENLEIEFEIKPIPDINNPPKYGQHVQNIFTEISETNTTLFTENEYTSDCFVKYGHNYQVIRPTELPIRATAIREMMRKNENWQQYVPEHVVGLLK